MCTLLAARTLVRIWLAHEAGTIAVNELRRACARSRRDWGALINWISGNVRCVRQQADSRNLTH
jgi:hypothetical protein